MSTSDLKDFTKKTIEILSKIVTKPPLTTKLLSKPPFRYLHDMFSEIIKTTGFAAGLYTIDEMNHENIKDKESKIQYLTKMIEMIPTGVQVKVNPLKIVAGLEPEETNAMLQLIGKMVLKKVDTTKAIETMNGGSVQVPLVKQESIKSVEELPVHQKQPSKTKEEVKESMSRAHTPNQPIRTKQPSNTLEEKAKVEVEEKKVEQEEEEQPRSSVVKRTRPMSARPPPPKIKQAQVEETSTVPLVPISQEPQDDDEEFIVTAEPVVEKQEISAEDGQHGALVQKILQNKKQVEGEVIKGPASAREFQFLRESIQTLCQSTNPLGKTLDYLQEDVDAMNKEYEVWKRECGNFKMQAKEQEKMTMEAIAPLQDKLTQTEQQIEEQIKKITMLKAEILINDQTIENLMKNIVPMN